MQEGTLTKKIGFEKVNLFNSKADSQILEEEANDCSLES